MKIATSWSSAKDARTAAAAAYRSLADQLGATPQLLFLSASAAYDWEAFAPTLHELAPAVPIHGASSCMGVMTESGFHGQGGRGLGMLGILDPRGAYGVGAVRKTGDPRSAAARAARGALEQAGRPGEVPSLVWITVAPGNEELVLEGLQELSAPTCGS